MPLQWNGDKIIANLKAAEVGGLSETLEDAVDTAKRYVHVESGFLQSKIEVLQPAQVTQEGATGQFGVEGVAYALVQEFGMPDGRPYGHKPYLRPAFDIAGRYLAARIKKML